MSSTLIQSALLLLVYASVIKAQHAPTQHAPAQHAPAQNAPLTGPRAFVITSPAVDTIDFGRVRIGTQRKDSLVFGNFSGGTLYLKTPALLDASADTSFRDTLKGTGPLASFLDNATRKDTIYYTPYREELDTATLFIVAASGGEPARMFLRGVGVRPRVVSNNYDFGKLRDSAFSQLVSIPIRNLGSDSTRLILVEAVPSLDLREFTFNPDTLPTTNAGQGLLLNYARSDAQYSFLVGFSPTTLGKKVAVIHIKTSDGDTYDTIRGESVEPLVSLNTHYYDFGSVSAGRLPGGTQNPSTTFTIENLGSMAGYLDTISNTDAVHFQVATTPTPAPILHDSLAVGNLVNGTVTFNVSEQGEFWDTIYVANDTRYSIYGPGVTPTYVQLVLHAKVVAGLVDGDSADFDTVRNCDPVRRTLRIYNPYTVGVSIDSIKYVGDSIGFHYGGFGFPINIPSGGSYTVDLDYTFPADSLNGRVVKPVILYQHQGAGDAPLLRYDTVTLVREQRVLDLAATAPTFVASASDINPLRLPLTIKGPRDVVPELDDWVLKLHFSNDLYVPVGIDLKNAVAIPRDPAYPILTDWDQASRTYTITARNVAVSDPATRKNTLLLTILLRAFVTNDTTVTITPEFHFQRQPCAYNLESTVVGLPYANECGEDQIRAFMEHGSSALDLSVVGPVDGRCGDNSIQLHYRAKKALQADVVATNENGMTLGHAALSLAAGSGLTCLPLADRRSGVVFLTFHLFDNSTGESVGFRRLECPVLR